MNTPLDNPITPETFAFWMDTFAGRFGRVMPPAPQEVYFAILSTELDEEGFVAGCVAAMQSCEFWPTPNKIMAGAPASAQRAEERELLLREVLNRVNGYVDPAYSSRRVREAGVRMLGEHVWSAFQIAGGFDVFRGLQSADDERGVRAPGYPFVRKEFIAALASAQQATAAMGAIAIAKAAGQLNEGDALKLLTNGGA